jgi:hypothetical protein
MRHIRSARQIGCSHTNPSRATLRCQRQQLFPLSPRNSLLRIPLSRSFHLGDPDPFCPLPRRGRFLRLTLCEITRVFFPFTLPLDDLVPGGFAPLEVAIDEVPRSEDSVTVHLVDVAIVG